MAKLLLTSFLDLAGRGRGDAALILPHPLQLRYLSAILRHVKEMIALLFSYVSVEGLEAGLVIICM